MKKILLTALLVGGTFVGTYAGHHGHRGHRPPPRPAVVRPLPPPHPAVIVDPVYPLVNALVRPFVVPPPRPVIVKPHRRHHR